MKDMNLSDSKVGYPATNHINKEVVSVNGHNCLYKINRTRSDSI